MRKQTSIAVVCAALLCLGAAPAAASITGATTTQQHTGGFIVNLNEDGSAQITLQLAYDLESDAERAAFKDLKNNETLQQQTKQNFLARMQRVAASAENETGREMRVSDAAITFETANDSSVGLVKLSVMWTGLAATNGETLTVTEPFASGFEPERTFTVRGPDGYALDAATPEPKATQTNSTTWAPGTDLTGFEAVFTPAATATPNSTPSETTAGSGPGFGFVVTVLALTGTAAAVLRRQ